ncbi:MAG: RNA-binding protein [Bryobacterales bacterium]|nr:RNA-binding protein [Bryobacterales bacterium]
MVRLYVGNLPFRAMEEDLHAFFSEAGFPLDQASVVRDRTSGESRGFGFVEIGDRDLAEQAIQACNGRDMGGRALVVNEARPRTEGGGSGYSRPSGGGGGGGYNRRGGGDREERW